MAQIKQPRRNQGGRPRRWDSVQQVLRLPKEHVPHLRNQARECGLADHEFGLYLAAVLCEHYGLAKPPEMVRDLRGRDVTLPTRLELPAAS